jgi:hypothetical protein
MLGALALALVGVACGKARDDLGAGGAPSGDGGSSSGGAGASSSGGGGGVGSGGVPDPGPCNSGTSISGDVTIRTQDDAESLRYVTQIEGTLRITEDVQNVLPLGCLREVKGDVSIYETKSLRSLDGLEGLGMIGGGLLIGATCDPETPRCLGNLALKNVSALHGLGEVGRIQVGTSCGGEGGSRCGPNGALESLKIPRVQSAEAIAIHNNPYLSEVALSSLLRATSLVVSDNPRLATLELPNLNSVNDLALRYSFELRQVFLNSGIAELGSLEVAYTGLEQLSGVAASEINQISIGGNSRLRSLKGFERLNKVKRLVIDSNEVLLDLEGLDGLESVESELYVRGNAELVSLAGLEGLISAERLVIDGNGPLRDLEGLRSLREVTSLTVMNQPVLESLEGLKSLGALNSLAILSNASLEDLGGLEKVDLTGSSVQITGNERLKSLFGITPPYELAWIEVQSNDLLTSLDRLGGLTRVRDSLRIANNASLQSLAGLDDLRRVQSLTVLGNDALQELSGLQNLEQVDGSLLISENPSLVSLSELDSLEQAPYFSILSNNVLPTCEAERLLGQLYPTPQYVNIFGNDDYGTCND